MKVIKLNFLLILILGFSIIGCNLNQLKPEDNGNSYSLNIVQNENLSINEGYELSLSQNVRIHLGGAFYDKNLSEISNGTTAGGILITKEQIQKIEASIGQMWQLEINKLGAVNLREMTLTNLNTKEKTKGLYNVENRIFLTGSAASESYNNGKCGTIGLGLVKGTVAADGNSVSNGEISFTLLTGCNPLAVGINITFYYTAKRIGNGTGIPFTVETGTWSLPQSTKLLTDGLIAKRWKFSFYAKNGNVLKPSANDFIQFYANGDLDIVILGLYDKAKWKYNETTKALEVTNSESITTPYFIKNLDEKSLKVYTPTDEFGYDSSITPKTDIIATASANTKLLTSARWKVQSIIAGILTPTPKETDFLYFYPDGSYEQSILGFYAVGTWKWETSDKRISINSTAGAMARNILSITDKRLEILENLEGGVMVR